MQTMDSLIAAMPMRKTFDFIGRRCTLRKVSLRRTSWHNTIGQLTLSKRLWFPSRPAYVLTCSSMQLHGVQPFFVGSALLSVILL